MTKGKAKADSDDEKGSNYNWPGEGDPILQAKYKAMKATKETRVMAGLMDTVLFHFYCAGYRDGREEK